MKNLGIRINLFVYCLLFLSNSVSFAAFTRASRLAGPAARAVRSVTRPTLPLPGAQPARIRYPQTLRVPSVQPPLSGQSIPGRLPTSVPTQRISILPTQSTVTPSVPPVRVSRVAAPKREMPKLTSQQRLQNELAQKEAELAQAREAMRLRTEGTATQRIWQGLKNAFAESAYEQVRRLEAEVSRLKQELTPFVKQQAEIQAAQRAQYLRQLPEQIRQELQKLLELAKDEMKLEEILYENAPKSQLNNALQKVYANFQQAFQGLYNRYKTDDPITKSMFVEVWKKIKGPDQAKILGEIAQGRRQITDAVKSEVKKAAELPSKQVPSQMVPRSPYVVAPRPAQTGLPRFIPRGPREQIQQQTFRALERAQVPKSARPAERARLYQNIARNLIEQAQTGAIPRSVTQQFVRQQQPRLLLPARAGQVVQPRPLPPQLPQVMPKKIVAMPARRVTAAIELPQSQLVQQTPRMVDVFSVGTPTDQLFVDEIMQGKQEPFMLVQSVPAQLQQPAQVSIQTKNRQGLIDTLIIDPAQVAPEIREFIKPLLQDEPIQMAFYSPKKSILQFLESSDGNPLQQLSNALNDRQTVGVTLKSQPIAEPAGIETVVQRPMITLPEISEQIPTPMRTAGILPVGIARPQRVAPIAPQRVERSVWQPPTSIAEVIPSTGIARPQKVMPIVPQRVQRDRWTLPAAARQTAQQRGIATTTIASDVAQPPIQKEPVALSKEAAQGGKPIVPPKPIAPMQEVPLSPKVTQPVEQKIEPLAKPVNPLIALLQQVRQMLAQNREIPTAIIGILELDLKGLARMLRAYNDQLRIISNVIPKMEQNGREQSLYTSNQTLERIKADILQTIDAILSRL
ncbi:MAG: hypothetical protein WD055_04200 [Candidatus Dependentiae bacterium]